MRTGYNAWMSSVPKHLLTPAEYLAKERLAEFKSEFYGGEMFAMAGANRRHSLICSNLVSALRPRLRAFGCEIHGSDMKVKVSATGLYTYPDASIACGDVRFDDEQEDVLLNPCAIFEVLSKSTERRDRGWKFQQYRKIESLNEYILIAQNRPVIERFVRAPDGKFTLDEVEGLAGSIQLNIASVRLSLAEIYLDILSADTNDLPPDLEDDVQ
jgi:Uma2 family endonuclease